jgi:hypothetical protein
MRRSVDTPRSVSDAYLTTFTTSPVCGGSKTWVTVVATAKTTGASGSFLASLILSGVD